jgi:hypothetical protein
MDLRKNRLVRFILCRKSQPRRCAHSRIGRNEPPELYDLWHLTSNEGIELGPLADAMLSGRLAYQMTTLPEFDEVFRAVQRALRQADLQ